MRVFVTGATGFIGSAVVRELIAHGHEVLGLCRSEEKAPALAAAGAEVLFGSTLAFDRMAEAAASCDGVIHLAFNHDFSRFEESCAEDRQVVTAFGAALEGSSRPLLITSGTGIANRAPGQVAVEERLPVQAMPHPRAASEAAAAQSAARGVNVSVVRLPQVHDTVRQGLISYLIPIYREQRACLSIGDGGNRWPAAPVADVARLYRLALERAEPGAYYHAVAEEGVAMKDIAETLAARLDLPARSVSAEDARAIFGWMTMFAGLDMPASSARTREALGWMPTGPSLLEDLARLEHAPS